MIFRMFAVFDDKAKAYLPPFVVPEVGQAVRSFSDAVNMKDHQFNRHPSDYTLFLIADFDDARGVVTPRVTHDLIVAGLQVFKTANERVDVQGTLPLSHEVKK